jgi:hypothetical protein
MLRKNTNFDCQRERIDIVAFYNWQQYSEMEVKELSRQKAL